MKFKRFLVVFLISSIAFIEIPKSIFASETYKQGIYNISEVKAFNAAAKLVTPNNITSLIIIDSNGNEKFYKRFDTVEEIINLGSIKSGDLIAVVGNGEINITY